MTNACAPQFTRPVALVVEPDYGKAHDPGIAISGEYLAAVTKATFTVGTTSQDAPINRHEEDHTVITTVPSGLPDGNGHVTVTSPGGTSKALGFTILPTRPTRGTRW